MTVVSTRLRTWLNTIPIQDPIQRQMASLLQAILLGLMSLIALVTLLSPVTSDSSAQEGPSLPVGNLLGFVIVLLPFVLLRRGFFHAALLLIVTILVVTPALAILVVFDLSNNGGILFQFTLAIFLAGLLADRRFLLLVFTLSALLVTISAVQAQSAGSVQAELAFQTAVNFLLFNGLITLFLSRFASALREALSAALMRENELHSEITSRRHTEQQNRFLANLVASVSEGIIAVDLGQNIQSWNTGAEAMYGWKEQEVLGKLAKDILETDFLAISRETVTQQIMEGGSWSGEVLELRRDGTHIPVLSSVSLYRDSEDRPAGIVAVNRDITERKHTEEELKYSEERYRTLFESIDQGFCTIEVLFDENEKPVDYRFLIVNPAFERQTGIPNAIGRRMREIAPLHEEHWFHIYGNIALTGEPLRFENSAEQLRRYYEVYAWRIGTPEERKVAILFNDITQRKRAEERQSFLASTSKALASSLDYQTTLMTVAQLAVPKIADWCTVYLTTADGSIEQVALTHADPEKVKWALELQQRFPPDPNSPRGVAQVIRSGKAEFMPEIPTELLESLRKDPEISRLLDELQLTGAMTVPLTLHGQTIGAISLVSAESRLRYSSDDLELAEELSRRIAVAVENARLYQTAQQLNQELEQRVVERTAELSQANSLLTAMMDNVPDHIFFKDRQSRFIRNSRSQASMMGLSDPAEAVGKTDFDFFPHAQRAFEEEQKIINSAKPIVDLEEHVVWPDGHETWVSTTKVPLRQPDGEIIGLFGIARDITDRKHADQALRKAKAQLEAANKELESFSYSVSHDLRAPLRAIDGYSRMLLEDYQSRLDTEGKRLFNVVRSEAQRMGQLIDDLLAFSRLGRADMKFISMDMRSMVEVLFNELTSPETRARIDFQMGEVPGAWGDPSLIRQVWVNLLANAIKFSSAKERAVIQVQGEKQEDEIIYQVRDNGAGFDMKYSNKLFGVFQRLHSEREFEGTGVGLAIIQRVVARHGGRVWAEGETGKGATFYFSLPQKGNQP